MKTLRVAVSWDIEVDDEVSITSLYPDEETPGHIQIAGVSYFPDIEWWKVTHIDRDELGLVVGTESTRDEILSGRFWDDATNLTVSIEELKDPPDAS